MDIKTIEQRLEQIKKEIDRIWDSSLDIVEKGKQLNQLAKERFKLGWLATDKNLRALGFTQSPYNY